MPPQCQVETCAWSIQSSWVWPNSAYERSRKMTHFSDVFRYGVAEVRKSWVCSSCKGFS